MASQLGYSHARVWFEEELGDYLQTPDGGVVETPDLFSREYDMYIRLSELVKEFQDCEFHILLDTAEEVGVSDVDAIASAYMDSYNDIIMEI